MPLRIRNKWEYKGDEWWEWEAFIDDDGSGELKEVEFVEYVLHPTFPNPIRTITDKKSKFLLETSGWGTFNLKAFAYKKDGNKIKLEHEITLEYEPKKGVS
jgi:transcription initiation factor IIF auxiliary subunit